MANTKVQSEQIEDGSITADKLADGTIVAAELADNAVVTAAINADAVTGAKIADDAIDSEHYTDGSIDTAHIADAQITVAKMAANSVDSDQYVDGSIDTVHLGDLQVTTAKIANGNISTAKIADNAVTSAKIDTNIDIAGTFDVTGATTLDAGATIVGSGTGAGLYLNGTNSDSIAQGNFVRYGTNFLTQSDAANDDLITYAFNGSTFVNALNIKSDGKIGIGTTSPSHTLHVHSDDAKSMLLERDSASNAANLNEFSTHYALSILNRTSGSYLNFGGTASYSSLQATDSAGSATAKNLVLNQFGGNVGIGTGNETVGARLELDNPSSFTNMFEYGDVTWNSNNGHGLVAVNRGSDGYVQLQITSGVDGADVFTVRSSSTTGTGTGIKHNLLSNGNVYHSGHVGVMGAGPAADISVQSGSAGNTTVLWRWGANSSNTYAYFIDNGNDGVAMASGASSWSAHSDERTKENITDIGSVLDKVKDYRCVEFNRKTKTRKMYGFIAQDWETDFPHCVDEDTGFTIQSDGSLKDVNEEGNTSTDVPKTIAYTETIPILLKAIQEQQEQIEQLKSEIEALKS